MTARLVGLLFSGFVVRGAGAVGALIVAGELWHHLAPMLQAVGDVLPH